MMTGKTRSGGLRRLGRILPAAAVVALAAAGLTACSSGSGGSGGPTPTVSLWTWDSGDLPVWKDVQSALAKEGTKVNINVRVINPTSYDAVLQTAMNGGSGPDIFYDRAGEGTETYASAKLIAPLNGIISTKDIPASGFSAASYDGKIYGVPDSADTMEVFYNKQVLDKHGISVPTTWNQWMGDMKKLKSDGVTPMYVMGVQQWMLALQMDAINASTLPSSYIQDVMDKKANYENKYYVDSLKAFQSLAPYLESNWQAVGSADNEQETALGLGNCAFVIDGIFDVSQIKQANPSVQIGQFLVPSPDGQKAKVDYYPDANFSLNSKISDSSVDAAAKKVIAFTATPAFGNIWDKVTGTISPIKGATIPSNNALSVQAANWFDTVPISPLWGIRSPMDTPKPNPTSLKNNKQTDAGLQGIFTVQGNIAGPLLEGKITPEQAAKEVQSQQAWFFKGTN